VRPSRMLKRSLFSPARPGAPRRAFSQAAFSPRKHPQRSPLGEQAVLAAWGGWVGEKSYAFGAFIG
jgi:hypothetical protein